MVRTGPAAPVGADPSYECRLSDDGQNVKRCQKIADDDSSEDTEESGADDYSEERDIDDYSGDEGESDYGSVVDDGSDDDSAYTTFVDDWGDCTQDNVGCKTKTSVCVAYSDYYSQCKPATLPSGELCGQNDGTNVWEYDYCPSGEMCKANGSDYRCTKSKKHHHHRRNHHHHHRA